MNGDLEHIVQLHRSSHHTQTVLNSCEVSITESRAARQ